jgi:hypothetical protein
MALSLGGLVSGIQSLLGQVVTALRFTSTAATGVDAFSATTNGARFHIGAGTTDYLSSDGTTISSAAPIAVTGFPSGYATGGSLTLGSISAGVSALWMNVTPSGSNYAFVQDGSNVSLNVLNAGIFQLLAAGTKFLSVNQSGTVNVGATTIPDASGTPGNATQNSPRGRAAIAGTATTCTITNSQCTVNSVVLVTFESDPTGTRYWVVVNAGNFVVTVASAPAGTVIFRYVIFQ